MHKIGKSQEYHRNLLVQELSQAISSRSGLTCSAIIAIVKPLDYLDGQVLIQG